MNVSAMGSLGGADSGSNLLDIRDKAKWAELGRKSFIFEHRLAGHPLFERPRLAKLAEAMLDTGDHLRCSASGFQCDNSPEGRRKLVGAIVDMEEANSWIKLSHANQVLPEYDEVLQSVLRDVELMLDFPLRKVMTWSGMTIFMNPPDYFVRYHFDHESSLLLQIAGEKDVCVYPPDNRVLTETEIEGFYHGDVMAGRYREEVEAFATHQIITPGTGVHLPQLGPHSVRNNKQASISVSIFYDLRAHDEKARICQFNWYLRRMGITPAPVGKSVMTDRAKIAVIESLCKPDPQNWDEYMFSGVNRINAPFRAAKGIGRRLASLAHHSPPAG
ncbi:hypothetical protein QTI66_16470 [Variovorax sp. J22R133]|uniref:cupin-like domain-containing protein n=1 Tax=Variovorax brevis TaxID=3053503 RepID=UPI0025767F0E|nr:cupin-like domain-containing protein [Variovorax sp. J22R133]MDM0113755.1 hypothetical protein [Variovorax sp. J22R133]